MKDKASFLGESSAPRQDLALQSPWMNAAGMLGFSPPQEWNWSEKPGAFITNPISLGARSPAANREVIPFAGGFLLHSGLPNPGLRRVIKDNAQRWERSNIPIWVHLLADAPHEIEHMVRVFESLESVAAIEVGIPHHASGELALALIQAAIGELPVVAHIPLRQFLFPRFGELAHLGLSAISLGPPRGRLISRDGQAVSGRLYGPAILPLMFQAVRDLQDLKIPLIAGGGVFRKEEGDELLEAGARGIQLDAVLWK